ncbi:MAG: choice-of-anchor J domain-containing protein [Paludibacteraceae bacterium]|nr:choice-of-anchor J domain-containing protein [Paludibacteraceae bacterium]
MRKKVLFFGVLAMLFCLCTKATAQLSVLTENFESGMPSGWTVDPASVATPWTVSASGLTGVTAYGGTNYVSLYTTDQQASTKLVLPMQDLSSLTNPEVTFYLVQKARGQNTGYARDTLRLYVRTSATAAWTLVQTFATELTTWTKQTVDLSGLGASNMQFAFEYTYGAGLGLGIDNLRIGDASVCITPHNLQALTVTSSTADLMWEAYETAFQFGLKVSTTPLTSPATQTANAFDQTVYYQPFQVTGLTPQTTYYFYVSADCGNGDESQWSAAGQFKTLCAPVSLPYNQGFETTGDFATCWSKYFEAQGDWTTTASASTYAPQTSTTKKTGTYSGRLYAYYYYYAGSSAVQRRWIKSWMASPEINTTDITNKQVTFWMYGSTATSTLHVGLMSDPGDASTFEELASITPAAASTWEEFIIPFSNVVNTAARFVAFYADGMDAQASSYIYIDDVVIDEIPLCPKASVVQASNVTDNSARITWLGSAPSWNLKVSTTPLTDPATGTADFLTTTTTGSPFNLTGLSSKVTYYVYVQADCQSAGNGTSPWTSACTFTTTAVPAVTPYFCDFENPTDNAQWELLNGTQTNKWYISNAVSNGGSNSLYISNTNGTSHAYSTGDASYVYATRVIQFYPGVYEISFDWLCYGESSWDLLRAYLIPTNITVEAGNAYGMTSSTNTDPAGWIDMTNGKLNLQNTWQNASYMFTATDTCTYQLVFFWKDDTSGGTNPPAAVDNVSISPYTCAAPTNLVANNILSNAFGLTWTPSALGETQWEVEVSQGANVVIDTVVSTTSITLNGLSASTSYLARVRSVCSATETSRWAPLTVMTACGDVTTLPYVEDFENTAYGTGSGNRPTCWTIAQSYSSTYPYISTSYNHTVGTTGNNASLYFYASSTQPTTAVLPHFAVPGHTLSDMQVTFWMYYSSTTYDMTVGVMTDPTDPTTFTPIQVCTLPTASQWKKWTVSLASYTGTGEYIAFFDGNRTGSYNYMYIDDVVVELLPTCQIPTNATASPDADHIRVTWDSIAGAQSYEVALAANGENASTAVLRQTVTGNQAVFNNLPSETAYTVYVRSICSATDTSSWTDPVVTATTKVAEMPPIFTDFNNAADNAKWQLINGTQTNKWYIGNATGMGDSKSLYISNDNGTSNAYTNTVASYVYAVRLIKFVPGIYNISFDWKCNGESSYDLLRAFLVPATVTLAGGNAYGMTSTTNTDPAGWISLSGANNKLNLQTTWQHLSYDFTVTDTTIYQLVFFWKDDTSSGTTPPAAVDNVSVSALTCGVNVTGDIHDTYAVLNCSSNGTPVGYEIACHNAAFVTSNIPAGAHHVTVDANGVDSITGLTANTPYYAYVRAICAGGDTGQWAAYNFRTECATASHLPLFWDFNNESTSGNACPSCWTRRAGSTYPYVSSSYNTSLYWYQSSTTGSPDNYIATPRINVQDISETRVEFKLRYSTAGFALMVGIMSDPNDINTFVPIDTVHVTNTSDYDNFAVRFHNYTGNGKYIAFRSQTGLGSYYYCYMDDVAVYEDRDCQTPDGVTATQITGNGARINWNMGNGLSTDFLMTTQPVTDPDSVDGTEPYVFMFEEDLQDNYLDLAGYLDLNQTYYVYLRNDCQSANGKPSFWSQEYSFTTMCNAQAVPYVQNFNTPTVGAGVTPACWQFSTDQTGTVPQTENLDPYIANQPGAGADGKALRIYGYYSANGSSKACAVLPELTTSIDTLMLTFSHLSGSGSKRLLVGLMSDPSDLSTFTPVDTAFLAGNWNRQIVKVAGYNFGNYIAFMMDGDLNQASAAAYIDSVVVDTIQACVAPLHLTVANVTGSTAEVNVQSVGNANQNVHIQIAQGFTGSNPDAITPQQALIDTVVASNTLPLTVTGLNPLTTYQAFARFDCGGGNYTARYPKVVNFSTVCGVFNVPFIEDFNNITTAVPQCWTKFNSSATSPALTTTAVSGKALQFVASAPTIMALPALNIDTLQNYELSFMYNAPAGSKFYAGVMTNISDSTSFVAVDSVTSTSTGWSTFAASYANYTGAMGNLAFRVVSNGNANIDELYVNRASSCARPTNLTVTNIDTTFATLTWTAGGSETAWEVAYGPTGMDINNATPIAVTTTTYQATGLTPSTGYDFYVRAVCGGADGASAWTKATGRTLIAPEHLPLVTDFEDPADNSRWNFRQTGTEEWVIGSAVNNGGSRSLYVSDDSGANNNYNATGLAKSMAYRLFHFDANTYTLNFDWKANGESSFDYMYVFLATEATGVTAIENWSPSSTPTSLPAGVVALGGTKYNQSTTWVHENIEFDVLNGGSYWLVFYWREDSSVGNNPAAAVDNIDLRGNECFVGGVTARSLASDSITIVSAVTDGVGSYSIYVSPSMHTDAQIDAMTPTVVADSLPVTVGGLTGNTNYYVYVRNVCADGNVTTTGSTTVKTLCSGVYVTDSTSFTENFDNDGTGTSAHPSCWTTGTNNSNTYYPYISTTHNSGVGSLYMYNAGTAYYTYAATPQLLGTPVNEMQVNFNMYAGSTSYILEVGVMTDPTDISTFVKVDETKVTATSTWQAKSVRLNSYTGTGKFVAFRTSGASMSPYFDDVVISAIPACAEPAVSVSATSYDNVVLNIHPAHAVDTAWEYVVTPVATATAPVMANSVANATVNTTTVTLSTLAPNTQYSVYARTVCGTSTTNWGKVDFRTPCTAVTVNDSISYTEDFDTHGTGTTAHPSCWTTGTNYTTTAYPYISTTHDSGVGSLYFYGSTSYYSYAATPQIVGTPANGLRVTFKGRASTLGYKIEVGVMTDPADYSTFVKVGEETINATNTWENKIVDLNAYTGNGQYVAFRTPMGAVNYYYIEDVVITPIPACAEPTPSVRSVVGTNDMLLTIAPAHATDTQWEYVVTPQASAANPDMTSAIVTRTISTTTDTITGLSANTAYSVYARTVCDATTSSNWRKIDFRTPCGFVTVTTNAPFVENFDASTSMPNCWMSEGVSSSTSYAVSSPNTIRFNGDTGNDYIATPAFTNDLRTLRVSFDAQLESYDDSGDLQLGVLTDPTDFNTFSLVQTLSFNAEDMMQHFTIDLNTTSFVGPGNAICVRQLGTNNYWYWLDNFTVEIIPSCLQPVVAATRNGSNIDVTLTSGNPLATSHTYQVVASTSNVIDATAHTDTIITGNTCTIANIDTTAIAYNIFAREICAAGDTSAWAATGVAIHTQGAVGTIPFVCTFEDANENGYWNFDNSNNGWYIGTATGANNGGSKGLYVSDNNGTTNSYSGSACQTIAYRTVHFQAGKFGISYDYKCQGESNYDYMHVFLAPTTLNLSTITAWSSTTGTPAGVIPVTTAPVNGVTSWTTNTVNNIVVPNSGDYYVIFYWHNDGSVYNGAPAVDNINIISTGVFEYVNFTDQTCDGYNYVGNGFNINSTEMDVTTSPNVFTYMNATQDTIYQLTLNIMPSAETIFNDTICQGMTYTQNGFNTGNAGTYHRYLTSAAGCDSIITLNLVVNQGYTHSETVTVCASQLPYVWHGNNYTATGTYTHRESGATGCDSVFTLNLIVTQAITTTLNEGICQGQSYNFNGQSYSTTGTYTWTGTAANGCDSIVTLNLTVNPVHYETITLTIQESETPYSWNGFQIDTTGSYTWYGQTAAGCDSVVTLDIFVQGVGLDYAKDGMFAISPNPAERGQNVRVDVALSEAEREGVVVELFTSNGKLVSRIEPKEQPIFVKMPEVGGLYMVRLTTGTGRVMYGKVIVK